MLPDALVQVGPTSVQLMETVCSSVLLSVESSTLFHVSVEFWFMCCCFLFFFYALMMSSKCTALGPYASVRTSKTGFSTPTSIQARPGRSKSVHRSWCFITDIVCQVFCSFCSGSAEKELSFWMSAFVFVYLMQSLVFAFLFRLMPWARSWIHLYIRS